MRQTLSRLVSFGAAMVIITLHSAGDLWATPANALFKSKTLYVGTFGEIDVSDRFIRSSAEQQRHKTKLWLSQQKTKGSSDLYVQSNVWKPGGSTGWHTHAGHSLIIVTAGTVTAYDGGDPGCKPHVYTKGMTFVDPGGEHVHILRNEGDAVAKTIAVQLLPAATAHRIDAADPGNCHF
jgi:quercetin dioxygenase-like cupin family protein